MRHLYFVLVVFSCAAAFAQTSVAAETSCVACHADADFFSSELLAIAQDFQQDIHAEVGLSCHDCHGGNPDPLIADDMAAAMDEAHSENPYRGVPEKNEMPGFCGACHSDLTYMRRFRPAARVDQEQEYWTSQHGLALAQGDPNVATCTECHGTHGIRRTDDPDSTVYPTQVAETCRACHGDPERMSGYTLPDGRPLPVDQFARWQQSVHAKAMFEKEDLTAPTCNDCHGNHGAMPPGLDSVAFVCGQCHGREADIFRQSPKNLGFEVHNEYLAEAGAEGCAACHDDSEPQAQLTDVRSFGECAACHGNHGVVRPTVALLSPLPPTPCHFCHEGSNSIDFEDEEPEKSRQSYLEERERLLAEAETQGIEGEDLFNWLVDQALVLHTHTLTSGADEDTPALRPQFDRFFTKFRLGKTYYTYEDPATGEQAQASVVRCENCHATEPVLADEPVGARTAEEILRLMQELTSATARAERIQLRARRGGVETRDAVLAIDQAVDAQIGLEVLVHGFSVDEDGDFVEQHREGLEHAAAALEAGREALDHLAFRRRGLAVSLVIILAVLVGLGLKIREISARQDRAALPDPSRPR